MRKKTVPIMIVVVTSLILLGNSKADNVGILLKYFPKESVLQEHLSFDSDHPLNKIILLPEGPFDQEEAAAIVSRVNKLPYSLLKKIEEAHIRLKLFTGVLTDNPTAAHLKGIKPKGYESNKTWDDVPGIGGGRIVLVKIGHSEKGKGHSSVNLELHELAHSVDRYVFDELRSSDDFLRIWKDEKESLFPNRTYFLTYPEEYFAESFAMYYLNEETRTELKEKAPETYQFVKSLK
jgi:hypothetical protein